MSRFTLCVFFWGLDVDFLDHRNLFNDSGRIRNLILLDAGVSAILRQTRKKRSGYSIDQVSVRKRNEFLFMNINSFVSDNHYRWLYGEDCNVREKLQHIHHALLEGKEDNKFNKNPEYNFFSPIASMKNFYRSLR